MGDIHKQYNLAVQLLGELAVNVERLVYYNEELTSYMTFIKSKGKVLGDTLEESRLVRGDKVTLHLLNNYIKRINLEIKRVDKYERSHADVKAYENTLHFLNSFPRRMSNGIYGDVN